MITFKDLYKKILKEENLSEEISALRKKLSDYKTDEKTLIYRADNNIVDVWMERNIRKDRKPKDTGEFTDAVVSELEDHIYTQYPKRSESKFGLTKEHKDRLSVYSIHSYICFPHEDAKVASLEVDSYTMYFDDAGEKISGVAAKYYLNRGIEFPDIIEKFLEILTSSDPLEEREMNWVGKNWNELKSTVKEWRFRAETEGKESEILAELHMFMSNIEGYFENLEKGIKPISAEVIFDGSSYLLINEKIFEDYFVWESGSWNIVKKFEDHVE